jgi:predicted MFS family arabinose efflux permease
MAVAYLSFTCSHNLWHGCFSLFLLGFFLSLANVIILTLFQSAPEAQDVPVVMGMVNLISVASLPISMGLVGSFIEHVNVQNFAAICALIVIALALSIRLIPGIQRV